MDADQGVVGSISGGARHFMGSERLSLNAFEVYSEKKNFIVVDIKENKKHKPYAIVIWHNVK